MNPYKNITPENYFTLSQDEQLLCDVHELLDKGQTLTQILEYKQIAYLEQFKGEASPKQLKQECDKFWIPFYNKAITQR